MVEPVNALVADVAMTAPWQYYDAANGTNFTNIKLLEKFHQSNSRILSYKSRTQTLHHGTENHPKNEKGTDCGLDPVLVIID